MQPVAGAQRSALGVAMLRCAIAPPAPASTPPSTSPSLSTLSYNIPPTPCSPLDAALTRTLLAEGLAKGVVTGSNIVGDGASGRPASDGIGDGLAAGVVPSTSATSAASEAVAATSEEALGIAMDIDLGEGDVRPLVRFLRGVGAYAVGMMRTAAEADAETDEPAAKAARASMAKDSPAAAATAPITTLRISHPTPGTAPTAAASGAGNFSLPVKLALHSQRMSREASVELVPGSHGNLAALDGRRLHPSTEVIMHGLREAAAAADVPHPASPPSELASIGLVVDLFLADALAPAVVLITNTPSANALGSALLEALGAALPDELGFIRAIDVTEVKMNRSLYDERDSRSLRDEILDLRRVCNGLALSAHGLVLTSVILVASSAALMADDGGRQLQTVNCCVLACHRCCSLSVTSPACPISTLTVLLAPPFSPPSLDLARGRPSHASPPSF